MKYLSEYIEKAQSTLFAELGVFFAFSTKQFKEQAKEGVKYVSLGAGCICPEANAEEFINRHDDIVQTGIALDKQENSDKDIIWRELANHEAQISCDIDPTVEALEGYGYTRDQILEQYAAYFDHCVKHDLF